MIATTNGLEYYDAGAAYWDAKIMFQRYTGEFAERVNRIDVERIQESYHYSLKFARINGKNVSGLPEKLNLLLTKLKNEHDKNNVRLNSGL